MCFQLSRDLDKKLLASVTERHLKHKLKKQMKSDFNNLSCCQSWWSALSPCWQNVWRWLLCFALHYNSSSAICSDNVRYIAQCREYSRILSSGSERQGGRRGPGQWEPIPETGRGHFHRVGRLVGWLCHFHFIGLGDRFCHFHLMSSEKSRKLLTSCLFATISF